MGLVDLACRTPRDRANQSVRFRGIFTAVYTIPNLVGRRSFRANKPNGILESRYIASDGIPVPITDLRVFSGLEPSLSISGVGTGLLLPGTTIRP